MRDTLSWLASRHLWDSNLITPATESWPRSTPWIWENWPHIVGELALPLT